MKLHQRCHDVRVLFLLPLCACTTVPTPTKDAVAPSADSAAVPTVTVPAAVSPAPAPSAAAPADDRAQIDAVRRELGAHRLGTPRVVRWPVVKLRDHSAETAVNAALAPERIFELSIAQMVDDGHMENIDFAVLYNRDHILSLSFAYEGTGAYSSQHFVFRTLHLRSGGEIAAKDAFDRIHDLAHMIDADLQQAIATSGALDEEVTREYVADQYFQVEYLERFTVSDEGVTFHHPGFAFPHVALALEPERNFAYPFARLRPFIKQKGPLAFAVR